MTWTTVFSLLLICLSPWVGRALALLADRLPRESEALTGPSVCRHCERHLPGPETVPLVSYLRQRGRCRGCATPLPAYLIWTEVTAILAAVIAVMSGTGSLDILLAALWLWLLLTLAVTDLLWMRLPDPLTAAVFLAAIGLTLLPSGPGVVPAMWGAVLGAGSFAALRWAYMRWRGKVGLGLGDVKLMAGLGAYAGPTDLPLLVLLASTSALAVVLLTRDRTTGLDAGRAVPFGTALCAAAAFLWCIRAFAG